MRTITILLILVAIFGLWVVRPSDSNDAPAETSPASLAYDVSQEATETRDDGATAIDFALLDEARSVDLIDHELRFPDALIELDGERVSLIGFMAPYDDLADMRRFMVLPNYVGCKFCSPPNLTQVVYVNQGTDDARSYPFVDRAIQISGVFRLSRPGRTHEGQQQGFVYSIENAVVKEFRGEVPSRAQEHDAETHEQRSRGLATIPFQDLVEQVSTIVGLEPLEPIRIESVSAEALEDLVRADVKRAFPEETRGLRDDAYRLLGFLPEGANAVDARVEHLLAQLVAQTDEHGQSVALLDSVTADHPFVRLNLVGEIAIALRRQHAAGTDRGPKLDSDPDSNPDLNEDARRAHEALLQGFRTMAVYRYARQHGIPAGTQPPISVIHGAMVRKRADGALRQAVESIEFKVWTYMPIHIGSFFVNAHVGESSPIAEIEPVFDTPPATTMEFFRPRWYQDPSLWTPDQVPADFADTLLDTPPAMTDVLGIGSIVPILSKWYALEVAMSFAGGWVGDRWALWRFDDGTTALLLETRWRDEQAAIQFRNAIPEYAPWRLTPHRTGSTRVRMIRAGSPDIMDTLIEAASAP